MRIHHRFVPLIAIPLALACWHEAGANPSDDGSLSAADRQQLAQLRSETAIYHDIHNAEAMGWVPTGNPCLRGPEGEGDMGYHYINLDPESPNFILGIDPLNPDFLHPNVLVYEPQKDGSLRFVAVEYVVPYALYPETESAAPEAFGQEFHRLHETNGIVYDLWELHTWLWRENPNGLFYEWNPKVSCQYATY